MPSDVIIKMKCPQYLIKFLESIYGPMPLVLPRNNDLSLTLHHLLDRPPKSHNEDADYDGMLQIRLPYFEDKNVFSNYYLSEYSKKLFVDRIRRFFFLKFRDDVNKSKLSGYLRNEAVRLFMDKYDLNESCYDMLDKDYTRYYNAKNVHRHRRSKKQKKVCQ